MNKTELIAKAKLRLRKMSADTLDEDVEQLINVALATLNVSAYILPTWTRETSQTR